MKYGKIIDYNGSSGQIIDESGNKYILSYQNILYDNAKNGDLVQFKIEIFETPEIKEIIAINVKKIKE